MPRKERRPVRAIARRPRVLVAELPGLSANAASVRAGRRDGAKLAGRGTRERRTPPAGRWARRSPRRRSGRPAPGPCGPSRP
ncbi:hypothetical protein DNK56_24615 [Streptomyces sp. AC1-42W]|nr:hypothetical protein DNK56_24615 [Streptomyces sp. AC1-42W]PZT79532.1 hypothetical protein DNK55_08050 [Streptomyces sp. AC1-42T]